MKTVRRLSAVTILSLTLAVSVLAGHIETPAAVSPPPPPTNSTALVVLIVGLIYP